MKILNLYGGIGGNRKLWGDEHDITTIEINASIAVVYKNNFPNDVVLVTDAHQYLLDNYKKFDFIWSSPPCQSHSKMNRAIVGRGQREALYPDMKLYQEILFLQEWGKKLKWVVENVDPMYIPLINPTKKADRHLFWSNFRIGSFEPKGVKPSVDHDKTSVFAKAYGFSTNFKTDVRKDQVLRNCVNPQTGLYILDCAMSVIRKQNVEQTELSFNIKP